MGVIILIALLKGLVWTSVFPLFQSPDEEAHFSYVQYWVENGESPWLRLKEKERELSQGFENTLKYLEFREVRFNQLYHQSFLDNSMDGNNESMLVGNHWDSRPTHYYQGYSYPPLPHLLNIPAYLLFQGSILSQAMAMRITSVLLSIITMVLFYIGAKEVFKDKKLAIGTTLLILFHPMFSYLSAVINNDVLLNLAYAGFFMTAIKLLKKKSQLTLKESGKLFLWVALGIASKTQGYALLGLFGIFLLMKIKIPIRNRLKKYVSAMVGGILLVLMGVRFFAKNKMELYRDFLGNHSLGDIITSIGLYFRAIFESFWGNFGWMDTLIPRSIFAVISLIIILSLFGFLYYLWKNRKALDETVVFLALCSVTITTLYLLYYLDGYLTTEILRNGRATQGRYYFIIIFPLFVLGVKGLVSFVKKETRPVLMFGLCMLMILAHFMVLFSVIIPRYYV